MDVFDLDEKLLYDYRRFARSFTQIRARDIREGVNAIYATNRFWPDPLISINPNFEKGATVGDLAKEGVLHPHTAQIFRIDGAPMRLHRHQEQAVAKAHERTSFAVTTGTGSGKSIGLPDLLYQFIVSVARRVLLISRRSRGCGEVGSA
jgi:ATP-dependent helicase YprA (DUF1998 family)